MRKWIQSGPFHLSGITSSTAGCVPSTFPWRRVIMIVKMGGQSQFGDPPDRCALDKCWLKILILLLSSYISIDRHERPYISSGCPLLLHVPIMPFDVPVHLFCKSQLKCSPSRYLNFWLFASTVHMLPLAHLVLRWLVFPRNSVSIVYWTS